jgi:hypothetical protein
LITEGNEFIIGTSFEWRDAIQRSTSFHLLPIRMEFGRVLDSPFFDESQCRPRLNVPDYQLAREIELALLILVFGMKVRAGSCSL